MNKQFIIGGILLGIGFAAGYLFAKKKFLDENDESYSEGYADAKDYMNRKFGKLDEVDLENGDGDIKSHNSTNAKSSIDYNAFGKKPRVDYGSITRKSGFKPTPQTEPEPKQEDFIDASVNRDYPYPITFEEFDNGFDHHDKETLTYYFGDQVMTDERDQVMTDVEIAIGEANLEEFSADVNTIYIRNERLGVDYEVIRIDGLYSEMVLGETPDTVMDPYDCQCGECRYCQGKIGGRHKKNKGGS